MVKGTPRLRPDILKEFRMSALRDQASPQLGVEAEYSSRQHRFLIRELQWGNIV